MSELLRIQSKNLKHTKELKTMRSIIKISIFSVASLIFVAALAIPSLNSGNNQLTAKAKATTLESLVEAVVPTGQCAGCWGSDGCYGECARHAQDLKDACLSGNVGSYAFCEEWADRTFYKCGEEKCPNCSWVANSPYNN